jgi:hypothetical protein
MHLARHLVAASAHLQPTAKAGVALATQSAASVLNPGGMADSHVPPQLGPYNCHQASVRPLSARGDEFFAKT